jgi:hypothetical protein
MKQIGNAYLPQIAEAIKARDDAKAAELGQEMRFQ